MLDPGLRRDDEGDGWKENATEVIGWLDRTIQNHGHPQLRRPGGYWMPACAGMTKTGDRLGSV